MPLSSSIVVVLPRIDGLRKLELKRPGSLQVPRKVEPQTPGGKVVRMSHELIAPSTNDMDDGIGPRLSPKGQAPLLVSISMVPEANERVCTVEPRIRSKVPVNADVSPSRVMEPVSCAP